MALVKCKECGSQVSTEAKHCPHCGAAVPKKTGAITWIVLGLFVGGFVLSLIGTNAEQSEKVSSAQKEQARLAALTPEQRAAEEKIKAAEAVKKATEEKLDNARFACEEFVKKTLHDPGSAEFDDFREFWAKEERPHLYHVQASLRAKNGFGALRKLTVDCRITETKGNWIALALKEIH